MRRLSGSEDDYRRAMDHLESERACAGWQLTVTTDMVTMVHDDIPGAVFEGFRLPYPSNDARPWRLHCRMVFYPRDYEGPVKPRAWLIGHYGGPEGCVASAMMFAAVQKTEGMPRARQLVCDDGRTR